ncbi:glycosyltransferase family 4 protein [Deinococcus sp. YIM 77859]|uniref:glycosyltransferase family 4 protein n=1 Tax=Deinococcus sp. YIM 77859 TaxID=1540221 RepID=UPI00069246A8|nr:glycosyltransferase family 4 protein [Deinococcus sp. YIM 77859]
MSPPSSGGGTAGKPVRLTFLIDSMSARAGMERVTATVSAGLAGQGFDVQILTLRGETSAFELPAGVQLCSLGLPEGPLRMRGETLPLMRALRQEVQRRRPDVLIVVDTFLSVFAFPALLDLPVRRVAWEHFNLQTDLGMRSRRLGKWVAAHLGHGVVTLTERDAQQWRTAFPRASATIQAIPNPLSFAQPPVNPYSPESRTVLAIGRLDGQKGFDLLLSAWAAAEPTFPEWRLLLYGSGREEERLRQQAAALGLQRWELRQPTPAVEQAYRSAGVYVLSSRHEGLPMVLMESQAYGVPAVAFDCPTGPAELLASGGGVLVEPGNVTQLAGALRELLTDTQARQRMSERAYQGAQRYETERILAQWMALLGSGRARPGNMTGTLLHRT